MAFWRRYKMHKTLAMFLMTISLYLLVYTSSFEMRLEFANRPISHFIYHALHKTGSTNMRQRLRDLCAKQRWNCFTMDENYEDQCRYYAQSIATANAIEQSDCDGDMRKYGKTLVRYVSNGSHGIRTDLDANNSTWQGVQCCPIVHQLVKSRLNGFMPHFSLSDPENAKFLQQILPTDSVRFTMVREPVAQFVSYHSRQYGLHESLQSTAIPSLTEAIDLFHHFWTLTPETSSTVNNTIFEERYWGAYQLLTNTQAKELGWNGDITAVNETLHYLEHLDFVGLTSRFSESWTILQRMFHWPENKTIRFSALPTDEHVYNNEHHKKRKRHPTEKLTNEQRRKIRQFQEADEMLHNKALQLFADKLKLYGDMM